MQGRFPTAAVRRLAVIGFLVLLAFPAGASAHRAVVRGGHLVVDGKPFFPIMQWLQCPSLFDQNAALGVNLFLGKGCGGTSDADEVAAAQQAHSFSVLPTESSLADGTAQIGWHFDDEPDANGIRPATIHTQYLANKRRNPQMVNFLTITDDFSSRQHPPSWMHNSLAPYRAYAQATDMIGTDVYPVYGWCRPDWIDWVAQAQRELVALAGGKPTYQLIEAASTSSQWCTGRGVEPQELRAEVWMAITNGAKGIGYFTHSWRGSYSQFRVAANVQAEMKRTDAQLAQLTPAILGTPVAVKISGAGSSVDAIARRAGGKLYVFAVNTSRTAVQASFTSPGLQGRATVIGENRGVTVTGGTIADRFAPLAVHLYSVG